MVNTNTRKPNTVLTSISKIINNPKISGKITSSDINIYISEILSLASHNSKINNAISNFMNMYNIMSINNIRSLLMNNGRFDNESNLITGLELFKPQFENPNLLVILKQNGELEPLNLNDIKGMVGIVQEAINSF